MDTPNLAVVLDLMLRAAMQMQAYTALVQRSRAENRDVSTTELAGLKDSYAAERDELQALADERRR